jgi:hypothetical protein
MLGEKKTPNVSKLSKIVENNFNHFFPQKQPCFVTIIKLDNGLIKI